MNKYALLFLLVSGSAILFACDDGDSNICAGIPEEGAAIEIYMADPACAYDGSVSRIADIDRNGVVTPLSRPERDAFDCQVEEDECVCRAGTGFGRYEVESTDLDSGKTASVVLDIVREASPVCVQTDVVMSLGSAGGAGGAGGAGPE